MYNQVWDEVRLPTQEENMAWELFHDNSKSSRYNAITPTEVVRSRMTELLQSLNFEYCPRIALPTEFTPLPSTLAEVITNRVTARNLEPCTVTLENIATIFHYAYGLNRSNENTDFPRPFRMVPSGGALYPLELFFHSTKIEGTPAGLYHYNPLRHDLAAIRYGDESRKLSQSMVQNNLVLDSALLIFITAMFERSTFKYGNRGYRFTLLEAGHVAQNINLVCTAMGLGCVNIGGYYDRPIDDLLGLDGINQSTVYLIAIGRHSEDPSVVTADV